MTTRSAVDKNIGLCLGLPGKILARSSASSAPSAFVSNPSQQGTSASEDTAGLDITDTAERTIDRIVIEEIFPEHSSSVIFESGVIDEIGMYPSTLEACITEIETLRCKEKALQLENSDNKTFYASCSQISRVLKNY